MKIARTLRRQFAISIPSGPLVSVPMDHIILVTDEVWQAKDGGIWTICLVDGIYVLLRQEYFNAFRNAKQIMMEDL